MKQLMILQLLILLGCGVEVGNPDSEEVTGNVTVTVDTGENSTALSLVDTANSLALKGRRKFELFLESIEIYGYSENEALSTVIDLELESIDLFSGQGDVSLGKAKLKAGSYDQIVLNLVESRPFIYLPDGENEEVLEFEDTSYRSIFVSTYLEVDGTSDETVNLDFDILSSIKTVNDRKVFKPRVEGFRPKKFVSYEKQIETEGAEVVCAYLFAPIKSERRPRPDGYRPPPKAGFDGLEKPSFEREEDLVLDENAECQNAFDIEGVDQDGYVRFKRLKPGYYSFRLFLEDGTFIDIDEKILLKPEKPHEKRLFGQDYSYKSVPDDKVYPEW